MTAVTGTLGTMSVPDLLQWLLVGGKTGRLKVVKGGVEKRLYFARGAIVGAASSDPDLAFGQFLLDLGKISEETLVAFVRRQRETGVLLGKLLVSEGVLSEEEVLEVLRLKARETVFELMAWNEGDFEFIEGPMAEGDRVPIELPIDSVIFEGIRRAESRRKIREAFPSGNLVPAILSDDARATLVADEQAAPMVSLMDRGCSLRGIARELKLSVVDVCRTLYPYLSDGMLVVGVSSDPEVPAYYLPEASEEEAAAGLGAAQPEAGPHAAVDPDPSHLAELAEIFLREGQFEEALATIDRARTLAPSSGLVTRVASRVEAAYREALWIYFANGQRVPVLAVGLRELPAVKPLLTSEEVFVATRITGGATVKEIVDMSPLPEFRTLRILRVFADAELVIMREDAAAPAGG